MLDETPASAPDDEPRSPGGVEASAELREAILDTFWGDALTRDDLDFNDGVERLLARFEVRPREDDTPGGCIYCSSSGIVEDYEGDRPCSACNGTGTPRPRGVVSDVEVTRFDMLYEAGMQEYAQHSRALREALEQFMETRS